MLKNAHPVEQEELMAYLDGELSIDRASTAAMHLENCRECQELAADLQGVSRRVMAWQVDPRGPSAPPSMPERRASRWSWKWGLAGTAVVAVGACIIVALFLTPLIRNQLTTVDL